MVAINARVTGPKYPRAGVILLAFWNSITACFVKVPKYVVTPFLASAFARGPVSFEMRIC